MVSAACPSISGAARPVSVLPEVDAVRTCTQCGTCSASCPLSDYMDHTPRQLAALLRAGEFAVAIRSESIWACTSCYECTVNCPAQIPLTEVIYGLKRASIRGGVYARQLPTPVLARQFVSWVGSRGRSSETWLSVALYLRTSPLKLVHYAPVALRLVRLGRLSLRPETVRQAAQLRKMLDTVGAARDGGVAT